MSETYVNAEVHSTNNLIDRKAAAREVEKYCTYLKNSSIIAIISFFIILLTSKMNLYLSMIFTAAAVGVMAWFLYKAVANIKYLNMTYFTKK
jgi:hypothetical protein